MTDNTQKVNSSLSAQGRSQENFSGARRRITFETKPLDTGLDIQTLGYGPGSASLKRPLSCRT